MGPQVRFAVGSALGFGHDVIDVGGGSATAHAAGVGGQVDPAPTLPSSVVAPLTSRRPAGVEGSPVGPLVLGAPRRLGVPRLGVNVRRLISPIAKHLSAEGRAVNKHNQNKGASWAFPRVLAVLALIPAAANSYISTAGAAAADPFSHVIGRNAERVPGGYQGQLTVFKHVSIWASSGPVTLALSSGTEGRVVKLINSLPAWPSIMCHESVLLYVLAFHPRHHLKPLYQFQGWGCTGEVRVTLNGTTLSPLEDRSCSLLEMVGSLAPASARGTRDIADGCIYKH